MDAIGALTVFALIKAIRFGGLINAKADRPAEDAQEAPGDETGETCGVESCEELGQKLRANAEFSKAAHGF